MRLRFASAPSFVSLRMLACSIVITTGSPAFSIPVPIVIGLRAREQMGKVAARWVVACMQHAYMFGERTMREDVNISVGQSSSADTGRPAITMLIEIARPGVTSVRPAASINARPKLFKRSARIVPVDKASGLPLDVAFRCVSVARDRGWQTTPTLTKLYTVHVVDLLTRLTATPRLFTAARGLLVPNYSTNGGF